MYTMECFMRNYFDTFFQCHNSNRRYWMCQCLFSTVSAYNSCFLLNSLFIAVTCHFFVTLNWLKGLPTAAGARNTKPCRGYSVYLRSSSTNTVAKIKNIRTMKQLITSYSMRSDQHWPKRFSLFCCQTQLYDFARMGITN